GYLMPVSVQKQGQGLDQGCGRSDYREYAQNATPDVRGSLAWPYPLPASQWDASDRHHIPRPGVCHFPPRQDQYDMPQQAIEEQHDSQPVPISLTLASRTL